MAMATGTMRTTATSARWRTGAAAALLTAPSSSSLAACRPISSVSPGSLHINVLITGFINFACAGQVTFPLVIGPFTPDLAKTRGQVLTVGKLFVWADMPL